MWGSKVQDNRSLSIPILRAVILLGLPRVTRPPVSSWLSLESCFVATVRKQRTRLSEAEEVAGGSHATGLRISCRSLITLKNLPAAVLPGHGQTLPLLERLRRRTMLLGPQMRQRGVGILDRLAGSDDAPNYRQYLRPCPRLLANVRSSSLGQSGVSSYHEVQQPLKNVRVIPRM